MHLDGGLRCRTFEGGDRVRTDEVSSSSSSRGELGVA